MPRGLNVMSGLGRPGIDVFFDVFITIPIQLKPYINGIIDEKGISYRCKKVTEPNLEVEKVDVPGGDSVSSTISYPTGRKKFGKSLKSEYIEGDTNPVKRFLKAYIDYMTADTFTGIDTSLELKTSITVVHYSSNKVVKDTTYYGCFPTSIDGDSFELKESASYVTRSIDWSVDYFIDNNT